jgi:GNAT superfamily N-acetyltransferase
MIVREIADADIPIATVLLGQLGYEMTQDEMARRLAIVLRDSSHRVWVCEANGRVVGVLHAFFRPALEKPPEVVVEALVVEAAQRSRGVGERLMAEAEVFARRFPNASVSLYSGTQRIDAHRFYERLGYIRSGTSALMRKKLA